jgi:hypothetical protein
MQAAATTAHRDRRTACMMATSRQEIRFRGEHGFPAAERPPEIPLDFQRATAIVSGRGGWGVFWNFTPGGTSSTITVCS